MRHLKLILALLLLSTMAVGQSSSGGGSGLPNATGVSQCLLSLANGSPASIWGSCSGSASTNWSALVAGTNTAGGNYLVGAGSAINTTSTGTINATGLNFGATGITLGTAPTSSQVLEYNGTNIVGLTLAAGSGLNYSAGTFSIPALGVTNAMLANSAITVQGQSTSLGGSVNINSVTTAHGVALNEGAATQLGGTAVGATGTVLLGNTGADPSFGAVPNANLANSTITIAGTSVALGGSTSSLPSPGAIGGTTPAAGNFTTLGATSNLTTNVTGGGTQCLQASNTGVVSGTGSACGSGGGSPITVNGGSALTGTVNLQNGSAVDGITINASNPSASNVAFAISGSLTNAGLANSSITTSCTSPLNCSGSVALGGSNTFNFITTPLTGQGLVATNGSQPSFSSPGVQDSVNSPVTSASYTLACDSGTALVDRAHLVRFQSGASTPVVPLSTASGCTGGFVTTVFDDGAGSLVFGRTSPDTFSVFNGSTASDGQTSFTLTNGQYATLTQGASGIWEVRVTSAGTGLAGSISTNQVAYATGTNTVGGFSLPVGDWVAGTSTNPIAQAKTWVDIRDANPAIAGDFCDALNYLGNLYGTGVWIDATNPGGYLDTTGGIDRVYCTHGPWGAIPPATFTNYTNLGAGFQFNIKLGNYQIVSGDAWWIPSGANFVYGAPQSASASPLNGTVILPCYGSTNASSLITTCTNNSTLGAGATIPAVTTTPNIAVGGPFIANTVCDSTTANADNGFSSCGTINGYNGSTVTVSCTAANPAVCTASGGTPFVSGDAGGWFISCATSGSPSAACPSLTNAAYQYVSSYQSSTQITLAGTWAGATATALQAWTIIRPNEWCFLCVGMIGQQNNSFAHEFRDFRVDTEGVPHGIGIYSQNAQERVAFLDVPVSLNFAIYNTEPITTNPGSDSCWVFDRNYATSSLGSNNAGPNHPSMTLGECDVTNGQGTTRATAQSNPPIGGVASMWSYGRGNGTDFQNGMWDPGTFKGIANNPFQTCMWVDGTQSFWNGGTHCEDASIGVDVGENNKTLGVHINDFHASNFTSDTVIKFGSNTQQSQAHVIEVQTSGNTLLSDVNGAGTNGCGLSSCSYASTSGDLILQDYVQATTTGSTFGTLITPSLTINGATSGTGTIGATATGGTLELNGTTAEITSSGGATFASLTDTGVTGSTQCLQANSSGAISGTGAGCGSGGSVTNFSAGNLSPLFTTSVATSTTTPALTFTASNAASGTFLGNNTNASAAPAYATLSAINPQTTTYQVLAADFAAYKTIAVASGSFTITLVASGSQPAAGQYINVVNYGTGTVTIARSGQSINGANSSIVLSPGTSINSTGATIWSDGTNYVAAVDEDNAGTGTVTSVATTSPITGGTFTTSGTIACATCTTSAAAITNNVIPKGSGGAQGIANSSITDNGTTIASAEQIAITQTSGTSTGFSLTNSTAATSSVAQSSPFDIRTGQTWLNYFPSTSGAFIAAASQADCWSHQVTETNGTNGSSIYVLLHNSAADNCQGSPANSYLQTPFEYNWGVQTQSLAQPSTPAITCSPTCASSHTWTYEVAACTGPGCTQPSVTGSTTTGVATLSTSSYNIITWSVTPNADYYKLYRTVSGGTPSTLGIIAVIPSGSTASGASCSSSTCVVNDEALAGDTTTAQAYNSSGQVYVGTGPAVGGGTGGGMFGTGGTVPSTLSATAAGWYVDANDLFHVVNSTTDEGVAPIGCLSKCSFVVGAPGISPGESVVTGVAAGNTALYTHWYRFYNDVTRKLGTTCLTGVQTVLASDHLHAGVYSFNGSSISAAPVWDCGQQSTATAGQVANTSVTAYTMSPGYYYIAFCADTAATFIPYVLLNTTAAASGAATFGGGGSQTAHNIGVDSTDVCTAAAAALPSSPAIANISFTAGTTVVDVPYIVSVNP
jgi:hypothetical protein